MKLKSTITAALSALCFTLLSSLAVNAQEGKSPLEIEPISKEPIRTEPDLTLASESDLRISNKAINSVPLTKEIQKDSSQVKSIKQIKSSEKTKKQEDPLSFNFLFYLIEKFKLSDIIE